MSSSPNLGLLIEALRELDEPSSLYPIAAGFRRTGEAARRGDLILVASLLIVMASEIDGEALSEKDWRAIRSVAADLAELVDAGFSSSGLAKLGEHWSARFKPLSQH